MPSPVKVLAKPITYLCSSLSSLRPAGKSAVSRRSGADIMVVVAYGLILPKAVLRCLSGCINVHGSLLPRWRRAPIQRSLWAGMRNGRNHLQMDG